MTLGLTTTGGEALAARLRLLSTAVRRKALLTVLRAAAQPIAARMAELASVDPSTEFDLKDAIAISASQLIGFAGDRERIDEYQAAVAIGPTRQAFYGLFLEYGTVRMSARPFMRPAWDGQMDRALTIMREGYWALLEAANTKAGPFREAA